MFNAVFHDTCSPTSFTSEVESTFGSKVASTVVSSITATLGELTVVNNDDGNDARCVSTTENSAGQSIMPT